MKKIIALFTFSFLVSIVSFGQTQEIQQDTAIVQNKEDVLYQNTLRKMFELAGSKQTFEVAIVQMLDIFKKQHTDIAPEIWDELGEEFMKNSMEDLITILTPIYQKYLSQTDLEGLIQFYESPVGIKFAKFTPVITQESMQAGQEWGQKLGEDFAKKLKERGY